MRVRVALALSASLTAEVALLAGCSRTAAVEPSAQTLYTRGPVAAVTQAAGAAPAEILVRPGSPQDACGIRAFVTARTPVLRRTPAGDTRAAAFADVGVGDSVEVYVRGPVALSCPAQGEASSLVLVGTLPL